MVQVSPPCCCCHSSDSSELVNVPQIPSPSVVACKSCCVLCYACSSVDKNFFFLCVSPGLASGLEITSTGSTSLEMASGQSVKLDCQFTLAAEDSGPLDIEWSLLASDNQKEDKVVSMHVPHRWLQYN